MKEQLQHLREKGKFTRKEAAQIMLNITAGEYSNEEIAAFLMALNMRDLVVDELLGFRDAMLERALQVDFSEYKTIDIVGTGGDGKNTFNISTCTAFAVAGAGYKVAKHGSYAVSSISGSANVLMELGINFVNEEDILRKSLEDANICFLHAPLFHPAMKHVVPIRRALRIKTIFNILGPLINPSFSSYGIYGVYSEELAEVFNKVLEKTQIEYHVVHGVDGYDEISLTDDTLILNRDMRQTLSPKDLLTDKINAHSIFGGNSVAEAGEIFLSILKNESNLEQKNVVVSNASLAIKTIDTKLSLQGCRDKAIESIESGRALNSLQQLKKITHSL